MIREKIIRIIKRYNTLYYLLLKIYNKTSKVFRTNRIIGKTISFIIGKPETKLKNKTVLEFCKDNNCIIEVLESKTLRPVYSPSEFPVSTNDNLSYYETPEVYYAMITDAVIWGDNDCISHGNEVLDDRFLYTYSDEIRFETNVWHQKDNNNSQLTINRRKKTIKEGIFLIGQASNNWYHWVFDILSRMAYINGYNELKNVPLLIDETIKDRPAHMHILKTIDKYSHSVIFIRRNTSYIVNKLHYFSRNTWSAVYNVVNNNRSNPARFAKSYIPIKCYREHILPFLPKSCKSFKKLFITRPSSATKRLINEKELSEVAALYGFYIYEPSQDCIEEQARMFNSADFIIAGEGAALVNMIWCKKGTVIACITCKDWNDYNYSTIAYMCGVNCTYLVTNDMGNLKHSFSPILLEDFLKKQGFTKQR